LTGARTLGMGNAFVAVAELSENPAALNLLPSQEVRILSSLANNRIDPYKTDLSCLLSDGAGTAFSADYRYSTGSEINSDIYSLAFSRKINQKLSIGGTLKTYKDSLPGEQKLTTGIDLGFFLESSPRVSWGLLLQDINQPCAHFLAGEATRRINIRGGYAYRPDDRTILAVDLNIYDPLGNMSFPKLSVGLENRFRDNLSLRLGWDQLPVTPFKNEPSRYSLGLGIKVFGKADLDYALLYTPDMNMPAELFYHYISLGAEL